jgi:hypothetical protein
VKSERYKKKGEKRTLKTGKQHSTGQHSTGQHWTAQHWTAQHRIEGEQEITEVRMKIDMNIHERNRTVQDRTAEHRTVEQREYSTEQHGKQCKR